MKKYVVGVDVGGTNIKLGVVGPSGKVIARNSFATKPFASNRIKLIAALSSEIQASIITAGLSKKQIAGVGIGTISTFSVAKGLSTVTAEFEPVLTAHAEYAVAYTRFIELNDRLSGWFTPDVAAT